MTIFTLNAIDAFGKLNIVEISAENLEEALMALKQEGFRADEKDVIETRSNAWWAKWKPLDFDQFFNRPGKNDLLRFIKMLGQSIRRGRTLKETLEFLEVNEDHKGLKKMIGKLKARLRQPFNSQTEVFGTHPHYFDEAFLGIVQAGESSGNLGTYLADYAEEKKKQLKLHQKFKNVLLARGATFLMVVAVAVVVILFVIPQFKELFGGKMDIPFAMNVLLMISGFFRKFSLPFLLFATLLLAGFYYLLTQNKKAKWWWHDFLLRLPIAGKTLRTYYTAQFTYLLSTLLTKNVDILKAMQIIIDQSKNVCLTKTYRDIVDSMKRGDDLFTAIVKQREAGMTYLVPSIVQAAKMGNATASLGITLLEVRNDLDELFIIRLERSIKSFSRLFYTLVILMALFIAYGVGGAVMAFYQNAQNLL